MTIVDGLYSFNGNVYYGKYPKEQTNGGQIMKYVKPERIKTDYPFKDDDIAVKFWQNHALTEPELANLKNGLDTLQKVVSPHAQNIIIDFAPVEQKLNISLPTEIKYLYECLQHIPELLQGKEQFLPLNEIYPDNDNLIFFKAKRTPVGFSLSDHTIMRYYKKEWYYDESDENFMQFAFQYISAMMISMMPYSNKAVLRGEIKSLLSAETAEYLQKAFDGILNFLKEYKNDSHYILYGENKSLIWYRSSGMYADMYIGSDDKTTLDTIINAVPDDWKAQWKNTI